MQINSTNIPPSIPDIRHIRSCAVVCDIMQPSNQFILSHIRTTKENKKESLFLMMVHVQFHKQRGLVSFV